MMNEDAFVKRWLSHIKALALDIGPRGSTTNAELRAADYCHAELRQAGLDPAIEEFPSARSIFHPHLLASLAMLGAFVLYPLSGKITAIIAATLATLTIGSQLMELALRGNILRRLIPKASSQNVFASIAPSKEFRQDIVLLGHVDTQRTPIIFRSRTWISLYRVFGILTTVAFLAEAVLYMAGALTAAGWIWPFSIPAAICAALLAAMCLQAETTPFTAGANDNASGAALVLALATFMRSAPLSYSRVWFVCTGSEEVYLYGAADFFRRHRHELCRPHAIAFELLGCAGPSWLTDEGIGIVVRFRPASKLLAIAQELASRNPKWGAYPSRISGGATEMAVATRWGVPAIAFMGVTRAGDSPHVHTTEDTFDKIDTNALHRWASFVWSYLADLDAAAK